MHPVLFSYHYSRHAPTLFWRGGVRCEPAAIYINDAVVCSCFGVFPDVEAHVMPVSSCAM